VTFFTHAPKILFDNHMCVSQIAAVTAPRRKKAAGAAIRCHFSLLRPQIVVVIICSAQLKHSDNS
jgi:hypothetical protein